MSLVTADLREAVIAIAREAAAAILAVYQNAFEVESKSDSSPLTAADLAAHRLIVDGLERLTPDWPILSEEAADIPWETRRYWTRYWLVDPLDGTREFVKRNGEFTVNIALIEQGVPFGVVLAPVGGTVWHGVAGAEACRRDGETDTLLRTRAPATGILRVAASRSHRDARTEALLARIGATETLGLGSSLKFCRIADGALDVYPRFGHFRGIQPPPQSCWRRPAAQSRPGWAAFRYTRAKALNGDFIALLHPSCLYILGCDLSTHCDAGIFAGAIAGVAAHG